MTVINRIYNIDSRNILSILTEENMVQTTITSPPYFDLKDYGVENQIGFGQSYEKYLADLQSVFGQILRRTKDDGTLWIIIDTFKRNGSVVPLPFDLANKLKEIGWHFQDVIVWKKDKTVPWSTSGFIQKKIEYILFFSKQKKYKYNKDVIRVYDTQQLKQWWVKYPERYNPRGKALDQVWEYPIPVQGAWGQNHIRHFCPLPQEMVATMILLSTDEQDVVLDPFSGSGTVLAQTAYMRRNYIGVELNSQYVQQSNEYIQNTIVDGKRKYDKFISRSGQEEFENIIWNLRALKYGRILLKNIEMRTMIDAKIIVTPQKITDQYLLVDYTILADLQNVNIYKDILNEITKNTPLKKFGIVPRINYAEDVSMLNGLHAYSITNTFKTLSCEEMSKAKVFSNVKLNIDEKLYEN